MSPVVELIAACSAFVGTHFLLSHPLRDPMVRRMGEGGFRTVYTLVALATFVWIITAWRAVPAASPAYVPGDVVWMLASALMLFASILLAGSVYGNPALPARNAHAAATRNALGVLAITRHPMMWSFAIWALVHMLIWPTSESHVLSSFILILAIGGAFGQDMKKARLMGDSWRGWCRRTAFVPFAGQVGGRIGWDAAWPGWFSIGGGVLIWLIATWAHVPVGARVAAGTWRWIGG